MESRKLFTNLTVGLVAALAVGVPLAQGRAVVNQQSATAAHAAQALIASDALWNAQTRAFQSKQAQLKTAHALAGARAIAALDARWNAEAAQFRAR